MCFSVERENGSEPMIVGINAGSGDSGTSVKKCTYNPYDSLFLLMCFHIVSMGDLFSEANR